MRLKIWIERSPIPMPTPSPIPIPTPILTPTPTLALIDSNAFEPDSNGVHFPRHRVCTSAPA